MVVLFLVFLETSRLSSNMDILVYTPNNSVKVSTIPTSKSAFVDICISDDCHSDLGKKES